MPLRPPERVLPTLNGDGTRRWIRPRLFKGRFYGRRLVTAWVLIAVFAALPFVRIGGKPAVLLDVAHRQFVLFGRTFLPTDGVLLMLFLLSVFVSIFLVTAVFGRVWCGWACPQTVYMEFLFRPLERLIEGDYRAQTKLDRGRLGFRRISKLAVFALVSVALGNLFLSYFVGYETLARWMGQSPARHPSGFLVMAVTASLVFFDFGVFREQMCTVACPYARLQSVLLDRKSLIVGYDERRGEPRGKKGTTAGDCVDCKLCVAACPTGIDIRAGLQLECIGCTQCIDACDGVMTKLHRPIGLIRYTSQDALEQRSSSSRALLRPRVVVYPAILAALLVALVAIGRTRTQAEVTLLRGIGAPFTEHAGLVENHVRVKVQNRTDSAKAYTVSLVGAPDVVVVAPENPMHVAGGAQETTSVFLVANRGSFLAASRSVKIRVSDGAEFTREFPYRLLGPEVH